MTSNLKTRKPFTSLVGHSGRKLWRKLQEVGPLYTAYLLAQRVIPKWLFRINCFFLCRLDIGEANQKWRVDPHIRAASREEVKRTQEFLQLPLEFEPSAKAKLFVATCEGRPVACMCLEPAEVVIPFGAIRLELGTQDIYGELLWVAPGFRGQGFGPRLNRHAAVVCSRLGYTRVISGVDALNRNSLKADHKVGYERFCRVYTLRLCGLNVVRWRKAIASGHWRFDRRMELSVHELGVDQEGFAWSEP